MAGILRELRPGVPEEPEPSPDGAASAHRRRWRLALAAGALICVLLVLLSGELAASAVRREIDRRLLADGAGANAGLLSIEAEQLSLLRSITFTSGLTAAVVHADAASLNRIVTPLQANSSVPMVDVALPNGEVLFAVRSSGAPRPVASRRGLPAIARSLAGAQGYRGGRFSEVVTLQQVPVLLTIGPVVENKTAVGVVLVMTPLADVLGRLATETGAALTAYQENGVPEATTAPDTPPVVASPLAASLYGGAPVVIREDPGDQREAIGRLIVDHQAAAILGVSVSDDSFGIAVIVDLVAAAAALAGAVTAIGVGTYRRRLTGQGSK